MYLMFGSVFVLTNGLNSFLITIIRLYKNDKNWTEFETQKKIINKNMNCYFT